MTLSDSKAHSMLRGGCTPLLTRPRRTTISEER